MIRHFQDPTNPNFKCGIHVYSEKIGFDEHHIILAGQKCNINGIFPPTHIDEEKGIKGTKSQWLATKFPLKSFKIEPWMLKPESASRNKNKKDIIPLEEAVACELCGKLFLKYNRFSKLKQRSIQGHHSIAQHLSLPSHKKCRDYYGPERINKMLKKDCIQTHHESAIRSTKPKLACVKTLEKVPSKIELN